MDTAHGVPFTDEWTSLEIRRNRKSFFFATVMLIGITFLGMGIIAAMFNTHAFGKVMALFYGVGCLTINGILYAQRLRDMNISGRYAFLIIPFFVLGLGIKQVPLLAFFILLCVYPGTKGFNKFGIDPLKKRRIMW